MGEEENINQTVQWSPNVVCRFSGIFMIHKQEHGERYNRKPCVDTSIQHVQHHAMMHFVLWQSPIYLWQGQHSQPTLVVWSETPWYYRKQFLTSVQCKCGVWYPSQSDDQSIYLQGSFYRWHLSKYLENELLDPLEDMPLESWLHMHFQHDRMPPHAVKTYLEHRFPG
jgi:hypothetical protein